MVQISKLLQKLQIKINYQNLQIKKYLFLYTYIPSIHLIVLLQLLILYYINTLYFKQCMNRRFIQQFKTIHKTKFPELNTMLDFVLQPLGKFYLNIPFVIDKGNKGYGLRSVSTIQPNESIFLISAEKAFTSLEYSGATQAQSNKYNSILQNEIKLVGMKNQDEIIKRYKIVIQLIANYMSVDLKLHPFAKYLFEKNIFNALALNQEDTQSIKSPILQNLINSQKNSTSFINKKILDHFIGVKPEVIQKFYNITISRSININQLVLCPMVQLINHSNTPNCTIEGVYFTHLQESFLMLKSCLKIAENEQLTISYGQYSNYDLFFRYGFTLKQNKFNYYLLFVDFEEESSYLNQLFQLKQRLFQGFGGIKEVVKLFENKVDQQSLKMLRIYFLTKQDVLNNKQILGFSSNNFSISINRDNERRVKEFLLKNLYMINTDEFGKFNKIQQLNKIQKDEKEIIKATISRLENDLIKNI